MKKFEGTPLGKIRYLLDKAWKFREGVVTFTLGEGLRHFLKKAEICYNLRKMGLPFYTEARFRYNMGRADILTCVEGDGLAIEILDSEETPSIGNKRGKYPVRIVEISINQEFREELIL